MCEYHDIPGAQSRQRFPLNGLVAQSRIAYQTAPIATLRPVCQHRSRGAAGAAVAAEAVSYRCWYRVRRAL